ncbi:MAG: hypothetical protein PHE66_12465 [Syntrophaceticus schinkii]|nr:hypothetical protein [Syntrophaceticus schinkii]
MEKVKNGFPAVCRFLLHTVSPSLRLGHLGGALSGVSPQQLSAHRVGYRQLWRRKKDPYKDIRVFFGSKIHPTDT